MKAKADRSLTKGERGVLLPGSTGAEPWELWAIGAGEASCVQVCAHPSDNRWSRATILALPAAEVFCLPLWLNETDAKQLSGMIPLQLELRGLQPRAQAAAIFDWSVVAQEGARTLVMVGVLPGSLPAEIQTESYQAFDLSARYLSLPDDALTLWRERDRLVVAITRGSHLVYFQALAESHVSAGVLQDLNCVRSTLFMQEVLTSLSQIMVWADLPPSEIAALREGLQLPVRIEERPPPQVPSSPWRLVPATVSHARQSREKRRWQLRAVWLVLAAYLLFVAWMVVRFFTTSAKVDELHKWQVEHATALALVRDTRSAWKDLRPVVDEKSYPLELLLHSAQALPADQLHLTLFEATDGHLLIKGEAKNVAAAFQFLDRLKKDPYFAGYTWDMAQPHLLPNDLAQLQIEGTRGPGDF